MFRLLAITAVVGGVALLVTAVSSLSTPDTPHPVAAVAESALHRTTSAAQDKPRRTPADVPTACGPPPCCPAPPRLTACSPTP